MGTDLLTTQISLICNSTLCCEQVLMGIYGMLTVALTSIIDSLGILDANLTIPFEICSDAARTAYTVANCSLTTTKHILPVARDACNLPLTNTYWPLCYSLRSFTLVKTLAYLCSGSDWDLFNSRSPNKWADGSLGSFLYSSSAVFFYLAASLSYFFFSFSCLVFCFFWSLVTSVPSAAGYWTAFCSSTGCCYWVVSYYLLSSIISFWWCVLLILVKYCLIFI